MGAGGSHQPSKARRPTRVSRLPVRASQGQARCCQAFQGKRGKCQTTSESPGRTNSVAALPDAEQGRAETTTRATGCRPDDHREAPGAKPQGPPAATTSKPTGPVPPPAIAPFDAKTAKEHQAAWAKYLDVPVEMVNSIGMRFVLIPPGEFDMGSTEAEVARLLEEAKARNQPKWYIGATAVRGPEASRPDHEAVLPRAVRSDAGSSTSGWWATIRASSRTMRLVRWRWSVGTKRRRSAASWANCRGSRLSARSIGCRRRPSGSTHAGRDDHDVVLG